MSAVNKIHLGNSIFNIAASDGRAKPVEYILELQGIVTHMDNKSLKFGNMYVFPNMENQFLKPSVDGFCYFFNGFEGIEKYKISDKHYKVPANILLQHMMTYESPWN